MKFSEYVKKSFEKSTRWINIIAVILIINVMGFIATGAEIISLESDTKLSDIVLILIIIGFYIVICFALLSYIKKRRNTNTEGYWRFLESLKPYGQPEKIIEYVDQMKSYKCFAWNDFRVDEKYIACAVKRGAIVQPIENVTGCYDYIRGENFYTCWLVLQFKNGAKITLKVVNNSEYADVYQMLIRHVEGDDTKNQKNNFVKYYQYIKDNGDTPDSYFLVGCDPESGKIKVEVNSLEQGYEIYKERKKKNKEISYGCAWFAKS